MQKQTFYRFDSKGRLRIWSIEVKKVSNDQFDIVTEDGLETGKLKGATTPVTKGLGKKSIQEQAIADAETEINKKVKQGYGLDKNNAKTKGDTATIKAPMKGDSYHPTGKKNNSLTLDKANIRGVKVGIQRKLDGYRFRIHVTKTDITFYSSSGDLWPEFPLVAASIRKTFDKNIKYWEEKYGVTEHYLDGEMYNHEVRMKEGFGEIQTSVGTTVNFTPEKIAKRNRMHFYIFDVCLPVPYLTRKKVADNYVDNDVVIGVDTYFIDANEKEIEDYFNQFLKEGYEGLMIRKLDMPYEYKRSKQLLKYKPEDDAEFQVIGFKKSITGETLGSLECIMEDGVTTFFADCKNALGTDKAKQEIWDNQKNYLGKWVTVTYMEFTSDNKPRNPKAKAWRKGKSQD